MKRLAITGGIGSGKSYVCKIFERLGIPVYCSDARTKALYCTDKSLAESLAAILGNDIISDGVLDRSLMAKRIFSSPELLAKVEEVVHPAVVEDFERWCAAFDSMPENERPPFVLMESAIILEKPLVLNHVESVINVTAPYEIKIARIMERDKVDNVEAHRRMDVQWDDQKRNALSKHIISNDGISSLLTQIEAVMEMEK